MTFSRKAVCCVMSGILAGATAFTQEKTGPEFPNLEVQISMLRPAEVKAFATDLTNKPGALPRFRFGTTNPAWELTWSFVERSDFGDIYKFTRVGPAGSREREISQRQVMYTGRETIIWQDEEQRIVLKPRPAPEE